jgi:serine/threonine protein kinase
MRQHVRQQQQQQQHKEHTSWHCNSLAESCHPGPPPFLKLLLCMQSHLSTMKYGTVTHQPPELLVAGKLTPQADIYSFGIMSELAAVTGS